MLALDMVVSVFGGVEIGLENEKEVVKERLWLRGIV